MNARVLIIDDVVCSRHIAKRGLEGTGQTVIEASTASDALSALSKESIDLILVDLMMLGKEGFELFNQTVRASGIPIFALTSSIDENLIKRAVLLGFKEVLRKPLDFQHLSALIVKHSSAASMRVSSVSIRLPKNVLDAARIEARKANVPVEEFLGGLLEKLVMPQAAPEAQAVAEPQPVAVG